VDQYVAQKLQQELGAPRSYDPEVPYEQQAFYRLADDRIYRDVDGNAEVIMPGQPLPSTDSRLTPDTTYNNWNRSDVFFVQLGEDEYWCMGDNRLGSHDCRFFGPIKERHIHGRIIFLIWSLDSNESWFIVDLIKHPIDFWTRMRWNRFFTIMN
jgi:signal peptidase I